MSPLACLMTVLLGVLSVQAIDYRITFPFSSNTLGSGAAPPGVSVAVNPGPCALDSISTLSVLACTGPENTLPPAISGNDYMQFSITSTGVGFVLKNVTSLAARSMSGGQLRGFAFASSNDNFASVTDWPLSIEVSSISAQTGFSAGLTSLTARVYFYGNRKIGLASFSFNFEQPCNKPTDPTGGTYPAGLVYSSQQAVLTCSNGYSKTGTDATCKDGRFLSAGATCVAANCPAILPLTGYTGNCNGQHVTGDSCTLACAVGFSNQGGDTNTPCSATGPGSSAYTRTLICCGVANCNTYTGGSSCTCSTCNNGFRLITGTCQACSVTACTNYDTNTCTCNTCYMGYALSGGVCHATTSSAQPPPTSSTGGGEEAAAGGGVPIGAVAGGAAGGILIFAVVALCCIRRRRSQQHTMTTQKLVKSTDHDIAMEEGRGATQHNTTSSSSSSAAAAATATSPSSSSTGATASASVDLAAAAAAKKEKDAAEKTEKARVAAASKKEEEDKKKKAEEEEKKKKDEEVHKKKQEEARRKAEEARKKKDDEEAKKKKEEEIKQQQAASSKKEEETKSSPASPKVAAAKPEEHKVPPKPTLSPANSMNSLLDVAAGPAIGASSLKGASPPSPKAVGAGSTGGAASSSSSLPTSTVLVGISGFPLVNSATVDKNHPESLRWVLSDRAALQSFLDFLKTERSDENILFYMAVESYRAKFRSHQLAHPTFSVVQIAKALEKDAAAIFKQYLQTNNVAARTVNLPEEVNARLVKNLRAFHNTGTYVDIVKPENDSRESWPVPEVRTPFDEPEETVYKLMETDSLRRFIKSDEGKEAMTKAGVKFS